MRYTIALVAAAYAVLAIASSAAAWMVNQSFDEASRHGGSAATLLEGLWPATRLPLAAAWLAAATTVFALAATLFVRRGNDAPPARSAASSWLAVLAIAAGASAVLMFRGVTTLLIDALIPGRWRYSAWLTGADAWNAVETSFRVAGIGSIACFFIATALAFAIFQRHAVSSRLAVVVLLVSLGASAALVADLHAFADMWHGVSVGSSEGFRDYLAR